MQPSAPAPAVPVEVLRVPLPAESVPRDGVLRRLEGLRRLDHRHVLPVLSVEPDGAGSLRVRLARPDAADLATVLAARAPLTPAEASCVLVSIGQALAGLHSAGLTHGAVGPSDVVLRPDGTPCLRPRMEAPGPPDADPGAFAAQAAEDVRSLGALLAALLPRGSSPALEEEIARALAADPRDRPWAGTLAARAYAVVTPAPVRVPEPASLVSAALTGQVPVVRAAGGRRRSVLPAARPGVALSVGVVVAGLGSGVAVGSLTAPDGAPPAPVVAEAVARPVTPSVVPVDPVLDPAAPEAAAAALTVRRLTLLAGAGGAVADVDLPGSAAAAADEALLAQAAASGTAVEGASVEVLSSRGTAPGGGAGPVPGEVDVVVEYGLGAHRQVSAAGEVTEVPASGAKTATLTLAWTDAGWRVSAVG